MELAVGLFALFRVVAAHQQQQALQLADMLVLDQGRGHGGDLALEQAARFDQLEGADFGIVERRGLGLGLGDDDAVAVLGLDHAEDFQGDQGFAQGRPADAVLLGQFAFGRQAIAHVILPGADGAGDGVGQLLIEFAFRIHVQDRRGAMHRDQRADNDSLFLL